MRPLSSGVLPLFAQRWSPRAMKPGVNVEQLHTLFEAARWAPSSFNAQPWRFLYARAETSDWPLFFDTLMDANKSWVANAGALICVLSRKVYTHNEKDFPGHAYDTGAARQNLMLQATAMGLITHAMGGFDAALARKNLQVPDGHDVHCMIAIGLPGDTASLPAPLQEFEKPSQRRPISIIAQAGAFSDALEATWP
ncbi:hypothetical protein AUJ68_04945 [Candidatus Woesearchaeota archaeon CG1_02_57_44]|nr:MAG: hypothetical protein AUJ68_04945 [Candidatus Woesearchaeota archaeon CG1_02_57_44]